MIEEQLYLPLMYEDASRELDATSTDLQQLFYFLPDFEEKVRVVLSEIRNTGKILFVYGGSGVGKTTFLHSLKYRSFLPIRDIKEIDALDYEVSASKLHHLFKDIHEIAEAASEYDDLENTTCVIISNLETLAGEDHGDVRKLFMNLNGLLRRYPLLLLWQVNVRDDLDQMLDYAKSIATTLVSSHMDYLTFTGPKQEHFPEVLLKNIGALYPGKDIYDFQLHDGDLVDALEQLRSNPRSQQTIREYFQIILRLWRDRSGYLREIRNSIPRKTELWIVLCHPEAEELTERSIRRHRRIEDQYNADYAALDDYIKGSKRRTAQWPEGELAKALSIIKTKIIFISTHAFINVVASYGPVIKGFPLSEEEMREWGLPDEYYTQSRSNLFLPRTPLVQQLALKEKPSGTWSKSNVKVQEAIEGAAPHFNLINDRISAKVNKWSDQPFNRALASALSNSYDNPHDNTSIPDDRPRLEFKAETNHPYFGTRPDILVKDLDTRRLICLEMFYTNTSQQNKVIEYTLKKLKNYWDQAQMLFKQPRLL